MTKASIPADQVRFFSGSSNPALAANIANELGVPLPLTIESLQLVAGVPQVTMWRPDNPARRSMGIVVIWVGI